MEFSIESRSRYVLVHFSGKGTVEEVKTAYLEAIRIAKEEELPGILIDSRESKVHPGFDAMRDLADFATTLYRSGLPRTALIVHGPLQYGLARMFGSLVEFSDWEFRIFRELEPAEAWLEEE